MVPQKMIPRVQASSCLLLLTAFFPVAAGGGDEWPDYRGPHHDGHSDATGLPLVWSETRNVAWKTEIHGRAWSSPVVADGEVWLTSATADGHDLYVLCIDAESGEISMDEKLFHVKKPQFAHSFNSYASPSPVIHGDKIFVTFGSPGTACLDRESKKVEWKRTDLVCNHFRGAGSSPLVYEDLLILTMDGSDRQYLIAMDTTTGKTRWTTARSTDFKDIDAGTGKPKRDGDFRKGFSTPIVIEVGGEPQLISPGARAAFAYDPRTGEEIWTVRYPNHSSASRSVFGHGLVFINTGYAKAELLAVRPTGRGDVTDTHIEWRLRKGVPNKPAPLLIGETLYMLNDDGVASCVEAKTGKTVWQERVGGKYSSALVYVDGRIYGFGQDGRTVIFKPGKAFESLGENQLEGGFMASAAIVGKAFFLRTKTHLYRIENGE